MYNTFACLDLPCLPCPPPFRSTRLGLERPTSGGRPLAVGVRHEEPGGGPDLRGGVSPRPADRPQHPHLHRRLVPMTRHGLGLQLRGLYVGRGRGSRCVGWHTSKCVVKC